MYSYPTDAISNSLFVTSTFYSMTQKKPDRGFSYQREYDVRTFVSNAGYEKRRLESRRGKRSYDLTYTNIDGLKKFAIENFYNSVQGNYQSFNLELSHLNEAGNVTVRFDGAISIRQQASNGSNALNNIYTVSFKLMESYD